MSKPSAYEALSDVELEEFMGANKTYAHKKAPLSHWTIVIITIILTTTVICSFQAIYLTFRPHAVCSLEKYHTGSSTEWDLLTGSIEPDLVTFASAFRYNETDKTYYREVDKTKAQYVGASLEVDQAWDELLKGQYLNISEAEAKHLDDPVATNGIYLAEPEIMHSLHCVNAIRKELHQEYYATHNKHKIPEQARKVHVEHCLEQLRQTIQCAGDLTPVPLRPYGEAPNINLIGTPQVHTCRNWDTFRSFYSQRGKAHGKLDGGGT